MKLALGRSRAIIRLFTMRFRQVCSYVYPRAFFSSERLGESVLRTLKKPPKVVGAYYSYVAELVRETLQASGTKQTLWLVTNVDGLALSRRLLRSSVVLQLEHTLVLPGGRDSATAIPGAVESDVDETPYLVRLQLDERMLCHSTLFIDYSLPNIINVERSSAKATYEGRVAYVAPLTVRASSREMPNKPLKVIMMASEPLSPRREWILKILNEGGIQARNVSGVWNDYESVLDETSLLVNVHQTAHHHTLEELRILPAVLRKVVVVSETSPLTSFVPYASLVDFVPYNSLVDRVREVLLDFDTHWNARFGGGSVYNEVVEALRQRNEAELQSMIGRGH